MFLISNGLFFLFFIVVLYMLTFAWASRWAKPLSYPTTKKQARFLILIPAYKEDRVIESSVRTLLKLNYPSHLTHITVVSQYMQQSTNKQLRLLGIEVIEQDIADSSKAKAMAYALEHYTPECFDAVVILDADNLVDPHFLTEVNKAFQAGEVAIQAHRVAKGIDTGMKLWDAISEEINNAIYRRGHIQLGLSCALSGSGMTFDYRWFCQHAPLLCTSGEDRELEVLLLRQRIHVTYLEDLYVYDEKIEHEEAFYNQRRRWMAAQWFILCRSINELPAAIKSRNWDYTDKIVQWLFPPRLILAGLLFLFGVLFSFIEWQHAIRWWGALSLLFLAGGLGVPSKYYQKIKWKNIRKIPYLFILMFLNLFRMKGANRKFIHTVHNENSKSVGERS